MKDMISSIVIAIDEFTSDVSSLDLVSSFFKVYCESDSVFSGSFKKNGKEMLVKIYLDSNEIYVNDEPIDFFCFIKMIDPSLDEIEYLEKISCLDIFDYISEIQFESGKSQLIDVKGKERLKGSWLKLQISDFNQNEYLRFLSKLREKKVYEK